MAKKQSFTETTLTPAEADELACWLSAKRAEIQAKAIFNQLDKRVLAMVKKYPSLNFDGARITGGKKGVWTYTDPAVTAAEHDLERARSEARYVGTATARVTEFPQCRDIRKFLGMPLESQADVKRSWKHLFTAKA